MNITSIAVFCSTLFIFLIFKSILIESCIEDLGVQFRCISVEACSATGSLEVSSKDICGPLDEGQCCPVINKISPPNCGIRKARIVYWQDHKTQTDRTSEVQSFGNDEKLKMLTRSIPVRYTTIHQEGLKIATYTKDYQNKTLKEVINAGETIVESTEGPVKVTRELKLYSESKLHNKSQGDINNATEFTSAGETIVKSTADIVRVTTEFKSEGDSSNATEANLRYSNTPIQDKNLHTSLYDEQARRDGNQSEISTKNKQPVPPTESSTFGETPQKQNSAFNKNIFVVASNSKNVSHVLSSPIPMTLKEKLNNNLNVTNKRENRDVRSTTEKSIWESDVSPFSHSTVENDSIISTTTHAASPTFAEINNSEVDTSQNKSIKLLITQDVKKAVSEGIKKAVIERLKNATESDSKVGGKIPKGHSSNDENPQTIPISENFRSPDNHEGEGLFLQTIGGKLEYEDWPWMVSIYKDPSMSFLCGGTLIDDRHIVSAAHCFYGRPKNATYTVSIGKVLRISNASDGHVIKEAIIHEGFKPSCYCNDIAVLRLAQPLTANYTPVCLGDFDTAVVGENSTILGWGDTVYKKQDSSTKRLQKVSGLPIISSKECRRIISRIVKKELPEEFEKYTICAGLPDGSKDACLGDSGGPLMHESYEGSWVLLGVVSFGYKCGEPGIPGTYSRLSYYMPWILKSISS